MTNELHGIATHHSPHHTCTKVLHSRCVVQQHGIIMSQIMKHNQTDHQQPPTRHTKHKQSFGQTQSHMRDHIHFLYRTTYLVTWEGFFIGFPSPLIVLSSTITLLGEKQWMPPVPSFTVSHAISGGGR